MPPFRPPDGGISFDQRALRREPVTRLEKCGDNLSVAFAILLGALFLGEHPSRPTIIGGSPIVRGSIVRSLSSES